MGMGKKCEMRLLVSVKELAELKKEFPDIKWEAGDTTIVWDSNKPEEVEMARKAFEAYKKKHPKAMAFSVDHKDNKGAQAISDFDPNAEKILVQDWMEKG
jgi:hypothetical protein